MLIQCTKKLLNELKVKPESSVKEDPLFCWHANLLTINRRKAVVLVNDKNRYVIMLYGLLAKDFKKLDELIFKAIRTVFQEEGIKPKVIEQFIEHSPNVTYTTTKDRRSVARMNASIKFIHRMDELLDYKNIVQTNLSHRTSRIIVDGTKGEYNQPSQDLFKNLEEFVGTPVFQTKAVQVKATLKLESFEVWRRIVIPLHYTFQQLHRTLQYAFSWKNYHLHEFFIYDNKASDVKDNHLNINHPAFNHKGKVPILNIVANEESFDFEDDIPMKLDTEIRLSDLLPKYNSLRYNYDFGDGWQHDIVVEKFIDQYDKNYPVCLEGKGNTPPEDVGGEYGYKEYLKIISDKDHPEYEEMTTWGRQQGYSEFDMRMVNIYLEDYVF